MSRTSLLLGLLLGTSLVACGSDNAPADTTDAAGDVAVVDSATDTKKDTGSMEAAPISCAQDLATGFMCPAFRKAAGKTTCTEAMLQDFVNKCVAADLSVPADCAAWKTANAACNTCVEDWSWDKGKVYPDDYQCDELKVPNCGKALGCRDTCVNDVCGECDDTPGTGTSSSDASEKDDCYAAATKEGGKCWDVASKDVDTCLKNPATDVCQIDEYYTSAPDLTKLKDEILRFLRGACRDNADWTNAASAGDGGVSDTGASDTGAGDTGAATDSGSDAIVPDLGLGD